MTIKITDAEAQDIIALDSNNFDSEFFYRNESSRPLEELQQHFIDCFPHHYILCGYTDNKGMADVGKAVRMRKINLRAKPGGWDRTNRCWYKAYPGLPTFMAFDIDENKGTSPFSGLFPDYRCYEIHDALDIPRPLVTTINPISGNCQFIYKMSWIWDDWDAFQRDPGKAEDDYNAVHKALSLGLGSDPGFRNHVVRSPMYIAGWHRKNPRKTKSKQFIELGKESLYHHSIWYEPKGYSLSELRTMAEDLRNLHTDILGNAEVLQDLERRYYPRIVDSVTDNATIHIIRNGFHEKSESPRLDRKTALALNPAKVTVGERNNSLFDYLRYQAYENAYRFKSTNDSDGFESFLDPIALEFNAKEPQPQSETEVLATVRSIVGWTLSHYNVGLDPTRAKELSQIRWQGHRPAGDLAQEQGIHRATFFRNLKKEEDNRTCLECGIDISGLREDAVYCSKKCLMRARRRKDKGSQVSIPYDMHSRIIGNSLNRDYGI